MYKKVFPKHLFLNISTNCNLNCEVCYGHLLVGEKKNMDLSTAKAATDFFYNNRKINYNEHYIMFFGGEPLLNFALIPEYLKWFKEKYNSFKCNFFVFTNGILLDPDKADFFITQNIPIFISYDTDIENFTKSKTGIVRYFDHIKKMIQYVASINPEMVIPYYIINEKRLNDFDDFIQQMTTIGIKKIAITRKMFTNWNNNDIQTILAIATSAVKTKGIKVFVYPEIASSCSDCKPQNMMVYPGGEVFDLCLVCASSLYKLNYIDKKELTNFYIGNIYTDKFLKMKIDRKRKTIINKCFPVNSFCPTLTDDLNAISYLWT